MIFNLEVLENLLSLYFILLSLRIETQDVLRAVKLHTKVFYCLSAPI